MRSGPRRDFHLHTGSTYPDSRSRPEPADTSGAQVRTNREAAGLTIRDLAHALDIPYQRLRRLEIDDRHDPELATRALRHLAGPGLPDAA